MLSILFFFKEKTAYEIGVRFLGSEMCIRVIVVSVCPIIDDSLVGYPIRKAIYPIIEKKKAMATYRRYIKTYCEEAVEKSIYGIIEEIHKEKI